MMELINMDKHYIGPRWIDALANKYISLIELLKGKLQRNILITKSDMKRCNDILDELKSKYQFNTDWRGDIIDCKLYTEYIMNK